MHRRYACLWRKIGANAVLTEPGAGACASPDILFSVFQQHNQRRYYHVTAPSNCRQAYETVR